MISAATLQGHSGPHLFRFKEEEGAVKMGYKQWPYQSAPYKVLDVTPLVAAFNRDPDQAHILKDKGKTGLDSIESDLRKWREGGKLTEPDVEWWRTQMNGERDMAAPSAQLASSFHHMHFTDPGNQD